MRIQRLAHDVGEFPVMFFGSRDYCWLHSGRVFPYQEGDKGCKSKKTTGTHKIFQKGLCFWTLISLTVGEFSSD